MIEDKVLKTIHQNQKKRRQTRKHLPWNEEAEKIWRNAKKAAKKYNIPIWPVSKSPYALDKV